MSEGLIRHDCTLIRWNCRKGMYECYALKCLYCQEEGEKCKFFTTEQVAGPDPLYAGPSTCKKPPTRIPDATISRALRMKERGLTWAQIGKELGHDPRALQNRVCHDQRNGKTY